MALATEHVPLLERDAELGQIDAALVGLSTGSGRVIVVEGEAGIGKSTLLRAAVERARNAGIRVARARASSLERDYGHGVALALFEPLVRADRAGGLFAGAAEAARGLFAQPGDDRIDPPADPFATTHGLYWLTLNAVEHGPLVIAVDDAQWADEASLRFLHYLAHRVADIPVLILLTLRSGESDPTSAGPAGASWGGLRLQLRPLSEEAVGTVLEALDTGAGREASRPVWAATRGNPFFVVEIAREGSGAEGVPDSVVRVIERRIERLAPLARRVAEAVAVLGEEADLRRAAGLAGIADDEAEGTVRSLVRAAILDGGTPLAFVHPIVRDAVYSAIPPVTRPRAHRKAGLLLLDEGAPLGVVGAHLLLAETAGDRRVVATLRDAAAESLGRGEPMVAVRLLERALQEPCPDADRPDVLLDLARAEAMVSPAASVERYREVLVDVTRPRERATLLQELGHTLAGATDWRASADVFEQGMRELAPGGDPATLSRADLELYERLEAGYVAAAWVSMEQRPEAERVVSRILGGGKLGRVHRELAMSIAFQRNVAVSASAAELASLTLRTMADVPIEELIAEGQTMELASGVLLPTDEHVAQIDLLSRGIDAAERAGAFGKVGIYSYCRAWPSYYMGRLTDAIADAQASIRVAELGYETFVPAATSVLALALLEHGQPEAAAATAALDPDRWGARVDYQLTIPLVRGRIAMARGDVEPALALFEEASRIPNAMGMRTPVPPEWRNWRAVALARLGRRDEARVLAAEAVAIAREWGARWTLGAALRAAGLAEGGTEGIDILRESVELLEGSTARLEHTRALVELGSALRRAGHVRDARVRLAQALDLAHALGAGLLAERTMIELRAAGARPRRRATTGLAALTPSELRVVRLAAAGRTNREIAQVLFVTPKAVEFHLANAYPKLGVSSRQHLAAALGAPAS